VEKKEEQGRKREPKGKAGETAGKLTHGIEMIWEMNTRGGQQNCPAVGNKLRATGNRERPRASGKKEKKKVILH
jgi:hypothetical protein